MVKCPYRVGSVAARVEQAPSTPPATLLESVHEPPAVYASVGDYDIVMPRAGDEVGMTRAHARAFLAAYVGAHRSARLEKLTAFVNDTTPGTGFYARQIARWGSLTDNKQPDPTAQQYVYVARERLTGWIAGFAASWRPYRIYPSYEPPMQKATDRIEAVYVDPEHQRRGLGSALLAAVMKPLGYGCSVVLATTENTPAVAFYEKNGFVPCPMWAVDYPSYPLEHAIWLPPLAMSYEGSQPPLTTEEALAMLGPKRP